MHLPPFGVEEWLTQHEMNARYNLAGVSIQALTLDQLLQLSQTDPQTFFQDMAQTTFDYGWIEGSPAFQEAASAIYKQVPPAGILQTNGATGANFLVLYTLIEPGDHVISLYPSYQQLYDIPASLGAQVDYWTIREELGWLPDLEELRQLIRPNTKMICINNANNPTGAIMPADYLAELVRIAQSCGAYILADEVYHSFAPEKVPAIADLYDKGISVNSLSKTYSLPGTRIGWVAAQPALIDQLKSHREYTMICAGVFDDKLATLALQNRSAILQRNQELLTTNLAILEDWIAKEDKASFIRPAATSTSFVKLAVNQPIEEFCLQLLEKYGVLVVPGNRFAIEGHVRIGYCCPPDTLRQGLALLSTFLHEM